MHKGDRFILNGNKLYISRAAIADTFIVTAVTDTARKAKGGITVFIAERDFPGFSIGSKDDEMGLRGSESAEVVFQDCEVPAENVVGVVGGGPDVMRTILAGALPGPRGAGPAPQGRCGGLPRGDRRGLAIE